MERNQEIKIGELKGNALSLLKGNWGISVLLNILTFVLVIIPLFIISFISNYGIIVLIVSIFFYFFCYFIYFWRSNCFFELNRENPKLKIKNIASYFENSFILALKYYFFFFLFYYLWALLMILVNLVLAYLIFNFVNSQFILVLMFVFTMGFMLSIYIKYSMVAYVLFENPKMPVLQAFKKGKELIKGYKVEYALMCLSFLGWIILCLLTFFIAGLWVFSYFSVTNSEFYRKLKEIKAQDKNPEDDFLSSEKKKEFEKENTNEYKNIKEENTTNGVYIYEDGK